MEDAVVRSFIFSTKVFAVSTLIFLNFSSLTAQPERSIYELPAGTRISVRMDTEINSKANRVGDTFIVRVVEPVVNRGVVPTRSGEKLVQEAGQFRCIRGALLGIRGEDCDERKHYRKEYAFHRLLTVEKNGAKTWI